MRKIVKEILEAESRVNATLQEARQKASERRQLAEREMSEEVSDARRQGQGIVQAAVEQAREEAEQIREETIRRADQEESTLLDGKADAIDGLVARVCAVVLSTEYEMEGQ
jgi:V/A-type H+-transporting ATPase subunit G/H